MCGRVVRKKMKLAKTRDIEKKRTQEMNKTVLKLLIQTGVLQNETKVNFRTRKNLKALEKF